MVEVQIELGPGSPGNWPFLFIPVGKGTVYIAKAEVHWSLMPSVHSFQEVIKKALLHIYPVGRIELRKVLQPVDFQPFSGEPAAR